MKISAEIISDIADNLEMGFICYLNKNTSQLIAIPGSVDIDLDDEDNELYELEPWYEDAKIVKASPYSFVQIDIMRMIDYVKDQLGFDNENSILQ